jgi:hypothetical protein
MRRLACLALFLTLPLAAACDKDPTGAAGSPSGIGAQPTPTAEPAAKPTPTPEPTAAPEPTPAPETRPDDKGTPTLVAGPGDTKSGPAPGPTGVAARPAAGSPVTCGPETRKGGVCTREYKPVCGSYADARTKTFPNKCVACSDEKIASYVDGPCPSDGAGPK